MDVYRIILWIPKLIPTDKLVTYDDIGYAYMDERLFISRNAILHITPYLLSTQEILTRTLKIPKISANELR